MLILPPGMRRIDMNVTSHEGKVVIQFSREIKELALTVEEAANFLKALTQVTEHTYNKFHKADDYSVN